MVVRVFVPVPVFVLNHGFVCWDVFLRVVFYSGVRGVDACGDDLDERVFVWVFFDGVVIHWCECLSGCVVPNVGESLAFSYNVLIFILFDDIFLDEFCERIVRES